MAPTLGTLIELIPELRTSLLMYVDPTSIVLLRRTIGRFASGPEMLEFASMATLLGIDMKWLRRMNRAGHHVILAGGGLRLLRSILEGEKAVALEDHVVIIYTKRSHCNDDLPVAANLSLALGHGLPVEHQAHITRQNEIDFAHQQIAGIRFIIFMVPPCGTIRNYSRLNIPLATFMMSFRWPSPFHTRKLRCWLGSLINSSNVFLRLLQDTCAKGFKVWFSIMDTGRLFASVHSGCSWLDKHIESCVKKHSPNVIFAKDLTCFVDSEAALYQICDGQRCNTNEFIVPLRNPNSSLINVYPNNDALTRKNCLSSIIEYWVAKRPQSILKNHFPTTVSLDLDYAEYIEYSLAEADSFELCQSMEANGDTEPSARDWWILKPAMTDCGYGIRIFSTMTDLVGYLESLKSDGRDFPPIDGNRVPSSLLREFVAQKYSTSIPLLNGKKFHVRAYTLAIGRLQVFVYRELIALIASEVYRQPWDNPTLRSTLTNSSLQPEDIQSDSVRSFWSSIPDDILPGDWKEDVFRQICQISAEVFRAASQTATRGLVLLPGCCELFALDFLIDKTGSVWLLEVNGGMTSSNVTI